MFRVDLNKRRQEIVSGNIFKILLLISIPSIITGLVGTFIPLIDTFYANKYLGNTVYSAISYSQSTILLLVSLSQGLSIAAMAIIGKAIGENKIKLAKSLSLQIFVLGIFTGILMMPICYFASHVMANTASHDMSENVRIYISMYTLVMPFYFIAGIFNSIKNVTGNPEAVLTRMLLILVLKVIFNHLYLNVLNLGIKGTIFSSLTSYLVISIWMYYDLFLKKSMYQLNLKDYIFDIGVIKEVIKVGFPSIISYFMIQLGFVLINMEIVKYGSNAVGALGISGQINNLCFVLPSNIGGALTTIVSTNVGAGNINRAKKGYKISNYLSIILLVIIGAIIYINNEYLLSFFTKDTAMLKIAKESLNVYIYTFIPFSIFTLAQSVLNALGRTDIPLFLGILRIWLIRYLFIIITQKTLGYYSIFYGNLISNAITAVLAIIVVQRIQWISVVKFKE